MNKYKRAFVKAAFKLDYLPRYGRVYIILNDEPFHFVKKWRFDRIGYWGFSFLDRFFEATLWEYLDDERFDQ